MKASEDRRVRRSRQLLGDALLALLHEHELSEITVRQVTDHADVGYMTFYRHFDSLDQLLVDRVSTLIHQEIEAVIADCDRQGALIFEHVTRYQGLYRTLLFSPGAARARLMLEQTLSDSYVLTTVDDPLIPAALRARHTAAAAVTLIKWWFEMDMHLSIDHMALMYNRLVIDGNIDPEKMRLLTHEGK